MEGMLTSACGDPNTEPGYSDFDSLFQESVEESPILQLLHPTLCACACALIQDLNALLHSTTFQLINPNICSGSRTEIWNCSIHSSQ